MKNELKSIAKCHDVDMRQIILGVTIKVECYCLEEVELIAMTSNIET